MLLTQFFVYPALERESLFNFCGYFIFNCIEKKCYVHAYINVFWECKITLFSKTTMLEETETKHRTHILKKNGRNESRCLSQSVCMSVCLSD